MEYDGSFWLWDTYVVGEMYIYRNGISKCKNKRGEEAQKSIKLIFSKQTFTPKTKYDTDKVYILVSFLTGFERVYFFAETIPSCLRIWKVHHQNKPTGEYRHLYITGL